MAKSGYYLRKSFFHIVNAQVFGAMNIVCTTSWTVRKRANFLSLKAVCIQGFDNVPVES